MDTALEKLSEQQVREYLTPFCDEENNDSPRYALSNLMSGDDFVAATDARVLVRVMCENLSFGHTVFPQKAIDSIPEIISEAKFTGARLSLVRSLDELETHACTQRYSSHCVCDDGYIKGTRSECKRCEGEGYVECEDCDGEGDVYCDSCHHSHDCDKCNGKGCFECERCKGEGLIGGVKCPVCEVGHPTLFNVGDNVISLKSLNRLLKLPDFAICFSSPLNEAVYFTWRYGDGAVMPVDVSKCV